tara:strand:+ start:23663 stop:24382 length:720 start_codon:yes stop_codon:yes gene_type:complete
MRFETELCHIDNNKIIVKVSAWKQYEPLGSALGEGSSVDQAEESAILKLNKRFSIINPDSLIKQNIKDKNTNNKLLNDHTRKEINSNKTKQENNYNKDTSIVGLPKVPDDWSKELSAIDIELNRIGWDKQKENIYINLLLGYSNRNRITRYNELKVLLNNLKLLNSGEDPSIDIYKEEDLIIKSSMLLEKLNWDLNKGRQFLSRNFNSPSRHDLTRNQLLEFNMLLTEELTLKNKSNTI